MSDIVSYLFETNAIKFCEENKPFFLTSGMISPYFSNTHFLYGSEKEAVDFLSFIDECLSNHLTLPKKIFEKGLTQYKTNKVYKDIIDIMKNYIEKNINLEEVDYISGGERRDWFFSNIIAHLLNKPHITLFKDLSSVVSDSNFENNTSIDSLKDKKVLHIADLITVASSYSRFWIPAIRNLGADIHWSFAFVDRMQGGKQNIEAEGIKSFALVEVNIDLFKKALDFNVINQTQFDMLEKFLKDPNGTMRQFLIEHPEFLENALNSDEKTRKRAQTLIDGNLYNL